MFYLAAPWLFLWVRQMPLWRLFAGLGLLWMLMLSFGLAWPVLSRDQVAGWGKLSDFLVYHPLPHFLEFILGATGARLLQERRWIPSAGWGLVAMIFPLLIYCLMVPESPSRSGVVMIQMFIPGAFLLILSMANHDLSGRHLWSQNRWLVLLGEASFALYMIHAILLSFFNYVRHRCVPLSDSSPYIGEIMTLVFIVSCLLVSVAVHCWLEGPTRVWLLDRYRRYHASCCSTKQNPIS